MTDVASESRWRGARATLRRILGAAGAAVLGTMAAGAISGWVRSPLDHRGGALREAALFVPFALLVAAALVPIAAIASAERIERLDRFVHGNTARARRLESSLLVAPSAFVLWIGLAARAGQFFLTAFHNVGLASLAQATALAILGLVVLGAAALARALVARSVTRAPRRRDTIVFFVAGLALAAAVFAVGIRTGNVQGRGGLLGGFGVLKKPELDLGPVYGLAGAFACAAVLAVGVCRNAVASVLACAFAGLVANGALRHVAHHFAESPSAVVIEARPSLARISLRWLRHRTDRDRDGASALFGGGDCNDRDPSVQPNARDVPGNGIDEDCSGRDAPRPPPPPPPPPPTLAERLLRETPADMNLVLITVDTLRADLHFAGNPRPLSPSLDRLATESVVFDHAYALSSYTGKAIAPLMAGRYPTECARDNEHFTAYGPSNVLLAERLRAAGFRTMGVASHFYFQRAYGLAQGVDRWDMSPMPGSDEQENVSRDAVVADHAIEMLRGPDMAQGRFFLWIHFFDPHKLYVAHPELASFGTSERARYDLEVEWTDRQIGRVLDALDALPYARRTAVVVTADHGEAFGEHDTWFHGVEIWDELVRVPWLVRVPGIAPRHVTVWRSQIDLVPTLLELLRVPAPSPTAADALSGASLVPDLLGAPQPPRPIYIELPEGPFNGLRRAVIDGGWKLTERGVHNYELYDLAHDPGERSNVARSDPSDLSRMRGVLESVLAGLHRVPASGELHRAE